MGHWGDSGVPLGWKGGPRRGPSNPASYRGAKPGDAMNRTLNPRSWALGISLAAGLLVSTVAQAHIALVDSSPAVDAVASSVTQIDLVFSERLVERGSRVQLEPIGMDGQASAAAYHATIEVINDGTTLRVSPHHTLDAGRYQVRWRVVGEDGHPATGDFMFTVE